MGGYYERLVGLVKRTLRKNDRSYLTYKHTASNIVKRDRGCPKLTASLENDIDSCITITPGHFLSLNRNLSLPQLQNYDKMIKITYTLKAQGLKF